MTGPLEDAIAVLRVLSRDVGDVDGVARVLGDTEDLEGLERRLRQLADDLAQPHWMKQPDGTCVTCGGEANRATPTTGKGCSRIAMWRLRASAQTSRRSSTWCRLTVRTA